MDGSGMSFGSRDDKPAYDLSRLNVLVVDDNKYMLILLKEILRALHVRSVQTAVDGADALKILKTFDADLIITDWKMDPLDGMDLVEMVRRSSDSSNPYVPIIMVTGHTEYSRVLEAINQGVNEFLAKPVSASSLYSRIVSVIERPRRFIRSKKYVGPDRRRRSAESSNYTGKLRRATDEPGDDQELSTDQIDAMFG